MDGSPLQRRLLAGRLEERGHDVRSYADAAEALAALVGDPVDAVVADVVLPGPVDGFELCELLRRGEAGPVVVLAPAFEPGEGDRRMAARAGAAAVVQRRAGFTDVLAALERALASRRPDLTDPVIPVVVAGTLQGRRAVLLGFTTAESDRAERVLRSAGVGVRSLARSADPRADLDADEVVLVSADAMPDELHHPGPVLAVGSPEGLCAAVPRGVRNLLTRPWRSEALLLRVYLAVRDAEPGGCRAVAVGEPPRNIVVADDDETITALLAATLRHGGYRCHVAHDGHQALELIERVRPGAAVLDVNMPRKDGFEVLAALQNGGRSRMLPVVLLTARRQELDVLRGFELGAADYVVKPFNPLELAARLKRLAPVR